jgi:hypothetical protein
VLGNGCAFDVVVVDVEAAYADVDVDDGIGTETAKAVLMPLMSVVHRVAIVFAKLAAVGRRLMVCR